MPKPRSAQVVQATETLRTLILAGESYRQAVAGHFNIGVTDTAAISNLAVHGSLGQTELADLLGRTTSSVTTMIDRLEGMGFVIRSSHPDDRRRAVITLTERGHEALCRSRDWFAVAFDDIPAEALPEAIDVLETLTAGLRRSTDVIAAETTDRG